MRKARSAENFFIVSYFATSFLSPRQAWWLRFSVGFDLFRSTASAKIKLYSLREWNCLMTVKFVARDEWNLHCVQVKEEPNQLWVLCFCISYFIRYRRDTLRSLCSVGMTIPLLLWVSCESIIWFSEKPSLLHWAKDDLPFDKGRKATLSQMVRL